MAVREKKGNERETTGKREKERRREGERKEGQIELNRGTDRVKERGTKKKSARDRENKTREQEKENLKERDLHIARAITQRFFPEIRRRFPHVLCCSVWQRCARVVCEE